MVVLYSVTNRLMVFILGVWVSWAFSNFFLFCIFVLKLGFRIALIIITPWHCLKSEYYRFIILFEVCVGGCLAVLK